MLSKLKLVWLLRQEVYLLKDFQVFLLFFISKQLENKNLNKDQIKLCKVGISN